MNTDKELLELAARAAGICGHMRGDHFCARVDHELCKADYLWNPLVNDTYAFRLAVKLRMNVDISQMATLIYDEDHELIGAESFLLLDGNGNEVPGKIPVDPYAATRRAIVRAAAEIGRKMK